MCKTFGHDTDEDVCRIGAQIHNAIKYQAQEPEVAEKNANAYIMANKRARSKWSAPNVRKVMMSNRMNMKW